MKVLVTGVGGQLGHDVMNELARRGHQGVGSDIAPVYSGIADGSAVTGMPYVAMDITNEQQVRQVMDQVRPDAVIHCAAWTAVDLAEDADKQPKVRAINVDGTAHLAQACREMDCKMMYISTDYVFNGQGETPWQPDCKDYQPLNFYGETKLGGELAVSSALEKYFIVRIAWVFGLNGKNFIKTMLQLGKTHDKLRVRQVRLLSRHQRGRVHLLVRLRLRDLPPGGAAGAGGRRDHGGIRRVQGGPSLQQPPGQEQAGGKRLHAAAGVEGRPEPVSPGAGRQSVSEKIPAAQQPVFFCPFQRKKNALYCQMRVFRDSGGGILLSERRRGECFIYGWAGPVPGNPGGCWRPWKRTAVCGGRCCWCRSISPTRRRWTCAGPWDPRRPGTRRC